MSNNTDPYIRGYRQGWEDKQNGHECLPEGFAPPTENNGVTATNARMAREGSRLSPKARAARAPVSIHQQLGGCDPEASFQCPECLPLSKEEIGEIAGMSIRIDKGLAPGVIEARIDGEVVGRIAPEEGDA